MTSTRQSSTRSEPDVLSRRRSRPDDGRWGILLGVSAVALVAVTILVAVFVPTVPWRLAVLVAAVAIVAERSADARTAVGAAVLAWPLGNGFLEHGAGTLAWNTAIDYPFTLGLLGATALGMCLAQSRLAWQHRQHRRPFAALLRTVARVRVEHDRQPSDGALSPE